MPERPWLKAYEPNVRPFIHIPELGIAALFEQAVKKHPDRPAIVYQNIMWTYSELFTKVKILAAFLISHGIVTGDKILIVMENRPEWLVAFLSLVQIGGEAVLICPCLSDEELKAKVLRSNAVGMVTDASTFDRLFTKDVQFSLKWVIYHNTKASSGVRKNVAASFKVFELFDVLTSKWLTLHETNRNRATAPLSRTLIQFSEGFNGGIIRLQHRSLLANAYQAREWLQGVCPIEKILIALPLSYVFSLSLGMVLALTLGAALVIPKEYDFFDTVQAIHDYTPEVVVATASVYSTIASFAGEAAQEYLFWPVQAWLSVLGSLAPRTMLAFKELTGRPVIETFGVKGCVITHLNPLLHSRLGSVGIPIPNTDARIVDLATGKRHLSAGEVGELVVAGDQLPNSQLTTRTDLGQAFFYSGELAWMDKDGFFYILGGKEEVIVSGGRIISPREVETALKNHPAVKECICIGFRDHQGEGYIKALIELHNDVSLDDLMTHCRLSLAPYKVPRRLEIHSGFPQTRDGQIQRLRVIEKETDKEKGYLQ